MQRVVTLDTSDQWIGHPWKKSDHVGGLSWDVCMHASDCVFGLGDGLTEILEGWALRGYRRFIHRQRNVPDVQRPVSEVISTEAVDVL